MPYTKCQALPAADGGFPQHGHDAEVDPRTGNGRADPGGDGHMHEIIEWHVQPSDDGHTHALECDR
jgi:hypothetical protein